MGDHQVQSPLQNGPLADDEPSPVPSQSSNPPPSAIPASSWWLVEQTTQGIIHRIQPTIFSEERRRSVVDYVQKLIGRLLGAEVFPFGSVPLKTYLPDGDIDLTAFCFPTTEDTLASNVRAVLEGVEKNKDSEFKVKDVQYIHAEVKLVKCLVQDIVVDISFNQIGGLCTLCFLEQVDCLIGKDHLFKRSIILIKAWCYYESRILGAHHSLISTYALETLVLYIFNHFHLSLDGPLLVLYVFLDYFSKFDWDNYFISLHGPVRISSLPQIVAEASENNGAKPLLPKDFFEECKEKYSSRAADNSNRSFIKKYLNIVDPLKENNNLGRSVSKGNFHRIRSAFTYGAKRLGKVLQLPGESIVDEVKKFFRNTLERHGSGERPDVQPTHSGSPDGSQHKEASALLAVSTGEETTVDNVSIPSSPSDSCGGLYEDLNRIRISGSEKEGMGSGKQPSNYSGNYLHGCTEAETGEGSAQARAVSGMHFAGKVGDHATIRSLGSRPMYEIYRYSPPTTGTIGPSSKSSLFYGQEDVRIMKQDLNREKAMSSYTYMDGFILPPNLCEFDSSSNIAYRPSTADLQTSATTRSSGGPMVPSRIAESSVDYFLGRNEGVQSSGFNAMGFAAANGTPGVHNLAELSGDMTGHDQNLIYAHWCHDHSSGSIPPANRPSTFYSKNQGDVLWQHNMPPHINGVITRPPFSPDPNCQRVNLGFISGLNGMEDMPKTRGIGTYFPNTNQRPYRDRQWKMRGKNSVHGNQSPRYRNNSRVVSPPESNLTDIGSHGSPSLFSGSGHGKPGPLEISEASFPGLIRGSPPTTGTISSESELEFGSFKSVLVSPPVPKLSRTLESSAANNNSPELVTNSPAVETPQESSNPERVLSFKLKDDGDFPPLSGRNPDASMHHNLQKTAWKKLREQAQN